MTPRTAGCSLSRNAVRTAAILQYHPSRGVFAAPSKMVREEPIHILLVDDHKVVRAGLALLIQKRGGMKVAGEAGSPAEALEVAKKVQPDVIVLDIDLAGESSLPSMPNLLEAAPECRIIVLTGVKDLDTLREAVRLGAMGVVPKDKAAEILIDAIEEVHAGSAWLDRNLMASLLPEISGARRLPPDPEDRKINSLTAREREVVELVGKGLKSRDIAEKLFISEITVRHHLTSIFAKLEVADRVDLMIYAYRYGLAKPPEPRRRS